MVPISRLFHRMLLLFCLAMPGLAPAGAALSIWVAPNGHDSGKGTESDPFLTIDRARLALRTNPDRGNQDVYVNIRDGLYRLQQPLVFDAADSGQNGRTVTYRGVDGGSVVLAGSRPVTHWTLTAIPNGTANVWSADVGKVVSRQFYVNGKRATRAKTSNYPAGFRPCNGPALTPLCGLLGGVEFFPAPWINNHAWADPATWHRPGDIEAVSLISWKQYRIQLSSVYPSVELVPGLLVFEEPGWKNANIFVNTAGAQNVWGLWQISWFENSLSFLDEPDEWYLDEGTNKIYFVAKPGLDMNKVQAELPVLEHLIMGRGTPEAPLHDLRFEGLTFDYATWLKPSSSQGYVVDQSLYFLIGDKNDSNVIGHVIPEALDDSSSRNLQQVEGSVNFNFANHIAFVGNRFQHLGSTALALGRGTQNSQVTSNLFKDLSAAAVSLGDIFLDDRHPPSDPYVTLGNSITNNLIRDIGIEYTDAPGIFLGFGRFNKVANNTIVNVPWSGVAIGWGWGLLDPWSFPGLASATSGMWGVSETPTAMEHNSIVANRVDHFLEVGIDGGAVYTTGFQGQSLSSGLTIAKNVATNKRLDSGGNTIYTDGGSRYISARGNVSIMNPQGVTRLAPVPVASDPLPYNQYYPLLLDSVQYGGDFGGCVTFGDINFVGNYHWYLTPLKYFDLCKSFSAQAGEFPIRLRWSGTRDIDTPAMVPSALMKHAGVQYRPKNISASEWELPPLKVK